MSGPLSGATCSSTSPLVQAFDSERIFYTVGPAWTLSVEWIFYLSLTVLRATVRALGA